MTIFTLAGSPSLRSRSSFLLRYATQRLQSQGLSTDAFGLRDIPAVDLIEGNYSGSAAKTFRHRVANAQALLIATPVYKASFAGGLKAILDLLDEKALVDKVILPIATGGSSAHLLALEYSLKPVLSALGARHILAGVYATDQQVTIDQDRFTISDDVRHRLDDTVDSLVKHVTTIPLSKGYDLGHLALNARFSI